MRLRRDRSRDLEGAPRGDLELMCRYKKTLPIVEHLFRIMIQTEARNAYFENPTTNRDFGVGVKKFKPASILTGQDESCPSIWVHFFGGERIIG